MIYRYEIVNNGIEDILYLYLNNMNNEFSSELTANHNYNNLESITRDIINNNNIKFNGKKVFLIINGIVVKTIDISLSQGNFKSNQNYSNDHYIIKLDIDTNKHINISLHQYLILVLGNYYNDEITDETLKCICILYRTYAYKEMFEKKYVSLRAYFNYKSINDYKKEWGNKYNYIYRRLQSVIRDTDCLFLSYNNKFILPFIHSCNNGYTYGSNQYPYINSVSSLWDLACPYSKEILDFDYNIISKKLNMDINKNSNFSIQEKGTNNQIIKLQIDNKVFSGEEFKVLLNLKSLNFNVILYNKFIRVITFGCGNSMGLSIFGANELAKDGVKYYNILKYYFPKTKLCKLV